MKTKTDNSPAGGTRPASHTPGPWHTGGIFNPESDNPTANVWGPTPEGEQSGIIVAEYVRLPDARIIAAAPDLLEACQRIARDFREGGFDGVSVGAIEDAIAAADKATS